jgi:hypothetical protein
MAHPAIIRTEFASAEDAAEVYGVPESRVNTIRKALTKHQATIHRKDSTGSIRKKTASQRKKRSAKKK